MLQSGVPVESDVGVDVGVGVGVGRLVDSGQAADRRMIRLVRARPLLYARNTLPVASYYTQVRALWAEVAEHMGWTVAEVRRKWSHVRNSYSRHLRNSALGAVTGRGRHVSRWYLADDLHFLREHMATDTRAAPYPAYAPSLLKLEVCEGARGADPEAEAELDVKPFAWFGPQPSPPPQPPPPPSPPGHEDGAASSQSQVSCSFAADETCSYFQFFRGLHAEYLELGPRARRLFKRQSLQLLHALLDTEHEQRPGAGAGAAPGAGAAGPGPQLCAVHPVLDYSILPDDH